MSDLDSFNRRLALTFGAGYRMFWDDVTKRWTLESPSADGRTVYQPWGWFKDANGVRLQPDPVTGLHAYRDLDATAQEEIIRNLHRSNIGFTGDGVRDWAADEAARRQHNADIVTKSRKQRAQAFADMIASVDIRRPGWLKDHRPKKRTPQGAAP